MCHFLEARNVDYNYNYMGRSRGRVQGAHPSHEMAYGFLIQLVFCEKKCDLLVLVTPFLSGAPLVK